MLLPLVYQKGWNQLLELLRDLQWKTMEYLHPNIKITNNNKLS